MNPRQDGDAAVAWGASLTLALLANGALVIAKEQSGAFRAGMAAMTGHHWTTHGVAVLVLFLAVGALFQALARRGAAPGWMERLACAGCQAGAVVASLGAIVAYYAISHWG
jgi:hypothetical protein